MCYSDRITLAAVAREEARITREHGFVIAPEARQRMLNDLTLQSCYERACVASRHTPLGVEILAVGPDEASQYRENHPPESRQDVRIVIVLMSRLEVPLAYRRLSTSGDVVVRAERALAFKNARGFW